MPDINRAALRRLALRLAEEQSITAVMEAFGVDLEQAARMFYSTQTYQWLVAPDDAFGVAREGAVAVSYRVIGELRGEGVY